MNILIVSAVFPPEPVVSSYLSFDIAEELAEEGHSVTVVCPRPSRPFGYKFSAVDKSAYKFRKVILKSYTCPESKILGRMYETFSFGLHCYRFIRQNSESIDIIYANSWPMLSQIFLVKAASRYKVPIIMHIQDIYPESIAEKQSGIIKQILLFLFIPLDKKVLKESSKIITISPSLKEYLIRNRSLASDKVEVVRNWQNDEKWMNISPYTKHADTDFIFMYLGSLNPSASVETVILAFVKAGLPGCKLIIAGEGSTKSDCMKKAEQFPAAKIEFIPAPMDKVSEIQQLADVLVLPLKKGIAKTATPSKLTAYMFSGKPILACLDEHSDTANCILDSGSGWVVEPENQEKLAIAMMNISKTDARFLEECGLNSKNYAINHLSKKINLIKITSIITGDLNDN
jgi:glycosyltransferase involved in cell wall biosynthesis